ncbi:MAG TPA: regulatory protein GemA [Candidatus Competibacteraceae bacterium]|nr:regulatory protein GemA [Candidatus Competibacteraceae bacterium]
MIDPRRADLAKIHLAKKQLHLDNGTYRALLRRVAGVDSAAALDSSGRARVLRELRRLGWRPRLPPRPGGAPDTPQARLIRALWLRLYRAGAVRDPGERALGRFVARMTGNADSATLDTQQANVVIEALKAWLQRVTQRSHG